VQADKKGKKEEVVSHAIHFRGKKGKELCFVCHCAGNRRIILPWAM